MTHPILWSRRRALHLGLGTLASLGVSAKGCSSDSQEHPVQTIADSAADMAEIGQVPLKQRAVAKGLFYGAAGNPIVLSDAKLASTFARECGILVPENELKWQALRPAPDRFDFTQADWLLNFARSHKMLFRGHTLVWDQALPDWVKETVNRQNAKQFLVNHIQTVVKHYAGQMHSWDVVNEAISVPYSGRSDKFQESPWLEFLGTDYIELAFRAAAAADPQAMLAYNDRWVDYDTSRDNAQRATILKLLEHLKAKNTPIHALGIQAHLIGTETQFNPNKLRTFLRDVASLGLKILITELDVVDTDLPADVATRDRIVASAYDNYLSVVLDEPAVIGVLTWGLSDRYTWLSKFSPRPDKAAVRPLPFDTAMKPKLAWYAMARAFDRTRRR